MIIIFETTQVNRELENSENLIKVNEQEIRFLLVPADPEDKADNCNYYLGL